MTFEEMQEVFVLMGSKLSGSGFNKKASCPLAAWTHGSGSDAHPSLSISTPSDEIPLFRCFTCQEKGSLKTLTWRFGELSKDFSAYEYVRRLFDREDFDPWAAAAKVPFGGYFQKTVWMSKNHDKKAVSLVSEEQLSKWLERVPKYAMERGLTPKEIKTYEVGYDPKEKRMIIPIRDEHGSLLGVSGRDVLGTQKPKYKHYFGFKKERAFYGEAWIDLKVKHFCLVEGFSDVWNLRRHQRKNVFATMGTSISVEQMRKLLKWEMVSCTIYPDYDLPGLRFAEESSERLLRHGIVASIAGVEPNPGYLELPRDNVWKPSDFRFVPSSEFLSKDPGDLSESELEKADRVRGHLLFKQGRFYVG